MKFILYILLIFSSEGFTQTILKPGPEYLALSLKALRLYYQQNYDQSDQVFDSLFVLSKGQMTRTDYYYAACVAAVTKQPDKAFKHLRKVLLDGKWVNVKNVENEDDLKSLHNDARWPQIIDSIGMINLVAVAGMDTVLMEKLDSILQVDQGERSKIDSIAQSFGWGSKQMDSLIRKMAKHDSTNLKVITAIIDAQGWLGPDKIGDQGSQTLFLVIQHADSATQEKYLPLMKAAVERGNAKPQDLALLTDRVLMRQGKKQIYGSQVNADSTGKYFFYPIEDEKNVNKRRTEIGLGPIEEYALFFRIE